jgi:hypothetical protein
VTMNNAAIAVWSLIKGARLEGEADTFRAHFLDACRRLLNQPGRERWTEQDFVAKWERTRDAARPRDLSHVGRARDGAGFGTNGTNGTGHARASEQAVGGGAWDAPDLSRLGTGRRPAPEFPLPLVGQFWAGWVERHAAVASAPVDYVAVLLLACMGSMLANVRWPVAGAGWSEPPVLWCGPRSGNRIKRAATPIVTATEMRLF